MKENKLGPIANTLCAVVCIVIFFFLVDLAEERLSGNAVVLNILLTISMIMLLIGHLTMQINGLVYKISIVTVYSLLAVLTIVVNFSNRQMFPYMMLTLMGINLFRNRKMLVSLFASYFLIVILSITVFGFISEEYENVFSILDIVVNVIILFSEFMALNISMDIYRTRKRNDRESTQTVNELIKVVGAKREDAIRANRSKSDFLANMSHEIRTPINAVLGFNEMILRESRDEVITEYAKDIRSSGTSLLNLVNEILDFSKIEAGKMEIIPVVYDLDNLFNDLINIIGIRAENKGLSLKVKAEPSLPRVLYGDEVRLKQIITNLLTNGVKYTDQGYVSLNMDYRQLDDYQIELIVSVEDTGRGIREEDMGKLFAPFERIEEISNRHVEGTGLGIALTRTLLSMMGSELEVQSTYGYGSIFSFRLRQEVENWEPIGSLDEAIGRARHVVETKHEFFVAPLAKLLVVDDIPVNLKVFTSLLKRTQAEIDSVSSGMEALSRMRKTKYDLIFLDHMMPGMDGIETLERMNSDRFNLNRFETPVIALTANAVSGAREMYIEKGFADYATKPVDGVRLEALLLKYLKPELIVRMDPESEEIGSDPVSAGESELISTLRHLPEINVSLGIETSGGAEIYEDVIKEYFKTTEEYSARIETYCEMGDIENYRIQVHSLKSTSRMAGAMEISELAAELEKAAAEGNSEYIRQKTPVLLHLYRSLGETLAGYFTDNTPREAIDRDTFIEALNAIAEGVEIFDYDLIESVMNELENKQIPDEYADVYDRMKVLVAEVNSDELKLVVERALMRQTES